MSGILVRSTLGSLPAASGYPGATLAQLTGDEDLYIVRGGAWVNLRTGGSVTLAGDVTGASNANTVVGLTGTAGVVAMHGTAIQSDGNLTVKPATTGGANGFALTLAAGDAATSGGALALYGGSSTTPGTVAIAASAASSGIILTSTQLLMQLATFRFVSSLSSALITQDIDTGVGATLGVIAQASSDNVGGNLNLGSGAGGSGNLAGNVALRTGSTQAVTIYANSPAPIVHFHGNSVRWSEDSSPALFQEQRSSDAATHNLVIQSQAPYASAIGNQLPGNIVYVVPSPVGGGDPPGKHSFFVSDVEVLKVSTTNATFNTAILFASDMLQSTSLTVSCEIAPNGVNGADLTFGGQQGGAGDTNGGAVLINAGAPSGAGVAGRVELATSNLLGILGVKDFGNGQGCVYLCSTEPAFADTPGGMDRFIFVGDYAGTASGFPVGGFTMSSNGGYPYFITSANTSGRLTFDVYGTAGALVGYMGIEIDENPYRIPIYAPA